MKSIINGKIFDEISNQFEICNGFKDEYIYEIFLAKEALNYITILNEKYRPDNKKYAIEIKKYAIGVINETKDREIAKIFIDEYVLSLLDVNHKNSLKDVTENANNFSVGESLELLRYKKDGEYLKKSFILKIKNIASIIYYLNIYKERLNQNNISKTLEEKNENNFKEMVKKANPFLLGMLYLNFKDVDVAFGIYKSNKFKDKDSEKEIKISEEEKLPSGLLQLYDVD